MLKSDKNEKLKFGNSEPSKKTGWAKLAEIKSKWTQIKLKQEVDAIKAEHDLRMTQMTELHELQKHCISEKHQLEIAILKKKCTENN